MIDMPKDRTVRQARSTRTAGPRQGSAKHGPVPWHQNPSLRAAGWMLVASFLFSIMGLLIKLLSVRFNVMEIAFFRSFLGLIPLMPFLWRTGLATFYTAKPGQNILRGLTGVAGMFISFYATAHLPLATSTAISFTTPLYMIFMAVAFLQERVTTARWVATAMGFGGVLVLLHPFDGHLTLVHGAALFSAFLSACAYIQVKLLSRSENSQTIVFYFSAVSSLAALVPTILFWQSPDPLDWLLLLLVGLTGGTAQVCMTKAYAGGDATLVSPIDYTRLLFAVGFGITVFADHLDYFVLSGSAIIIASTLYNLYRERMATP